MADEIAKIIEMIEEDADGRRFDPWRGLYRILQDNSQERMGKLLWEALRQGGDVGKHDGFAQLMAKAPADTYRAADVIGLLEALAEHYPKGVTKDACNRVYVWGSEDRPGPLFGFSKILEARADDEAFIAEFIELHGDLPSPWNLAAAFELAARGLLEADQLSIRVKMTAAEKHVHYGKGDSLPISRRQPWPEDVWGKTLVRAAGRSGDNFRYAGVLADLAPYADAEQMVELAQRVLYGTDLAEGAAALVEMGEPVLEPLERALTQLEVRAPRGRKAPWPPAMLIPTYLQLCGSLDRVPSEEFDPLVARFIEVYEPALPGDSSIENHAWLQEALAVLPAERLEPMLLEPETINLNLVGASPTPKVIDAVIEVFEGIPEMGMTAPRTIEDALRGLGPAAYPALASAMGDWRAEAREKFLETLSEQEDPAAAPVLVAGLEDRSKGVRNQAIEGLLALDADAVLDALGEALGGSRKATRLAAAKVLARLPASKRGYEMAQARLEEEGTADVKEVLETIEEPSGELAGIDVEAITEALSKYADWRQFIDEAGPQLVNIYVGQLDYWSSRSYEDFFAMIDEFGEAAEYVEAAVAPVNDMHDLEAVKHLDKLHEKLTGVGEALAARLSLGFQGKFGLKDALEWLVENDVRAAKDNYVALLADRRKTVRRPAVQGVAGVGPELAEDVWNLLLDSDTKTDGREGAAQALEALGVAAAVPHLEEALENESSGRVKEAIESALSACKNAAISVADFAEDAEGDAALDQALAGLKVEEGGPVPEELHTIRWKSGDAMSEDAADWFVRMLLREELDNHSEMLVQVRERLDDRDCYALCDALLEVAPRDDDGWGLYIQSVIGADRHIDALAPKLEDLASSANTNWGDDGVEVMVRHGSDAAVQWLDHHRRKSRRKALRSRANEGLARLAEQRDMSVDDLVMLTTPDFGFETSGQRQLDYGPRTIIARLDPENGVVFIDEKGEVKKSLPRARKSDDAEKVAAIKEEMAGLKRRIAQITDGLADRFEEAMCDGSTRAAEAWRERFIEHPITFALTTGLVFEAVTDDEVAVFAVAAEGSPVDVEGEDVALPEEAKVRIAHPVSFDADAIDAWQEHLSTRDISQPIEQLGRSTFRAEEVPEITELLGELPQLEPATLMRRVRASQYEEGGRYDAGLIYHASRDIGPYTITVSHGGYEPQSASTDITVAIKEVSLTRDDTDVVLTDAPARVFSEVVRDLYLLTDYEPE